MVRSMQGLDALAVLVCYQRCVANGPPREGAG
jgi:hypothetical protein